MKLNVLLLAALTALTITAANPAQQRKVQVKLNALNITAKITEPNGVRTYAVFRGVGINGPIEIPVTFVPDCPNPHFILIGPSTTHNHLHTVHWTDCNDVAHRWSVPVPSSGSLWEDGTRLPVRSSYGFGCGMNNPLSLDLDDEPALGSNRTLMVTDVPGTTTLIGMTMAFAQANPAYPLTALGLASPECFVHLDLNSAISLGIGTASGTTASFPLALPSSASLEGLIVHMQSTALSPGENPAGLITSNGLNLVLAQ